MNRGRCEWLTEQGLVRLRVMWIRGDATPAMARAFGVSKNALIGKVHRLDLPPRPNPARPKGTPAVPRPAPAPRLRSTLSPLASERAALPPLPPEAPPRDAPRRVIAAPIPAPVPAPVATPSTGECSWLISERPYRYCDAPTFGRLPYCECHAARAYVTQKWRQREPAGEPAHALMGDD
jgi:GcrA cell cycle regulator